MPQLIAVNPKFHQHTVVNPKLVEQEASELHLVPAVLNEFQKLTPLFLAKKKTPDSSPVPHYWAWKREKICFGNKASGRGFMCRCR